MRLETITKMVADLVSERRRELTKRGEFFLLSESGPGDGDLFELFLNVQRRGALSAATLHQQTEQVAKDGERDLEKEAHPDRDVTPGETEVEPRPHRQADVDDAQKESPRRELPAGPAPEGGGWGGGDDGGHSCG